MPLRVAAVLLLFAPPAHAQPKAADGKKPAEPKPVDRKKLLSQRIPGYRVQKIEGFDVVIKDEVFVRNNDEEFKRKPLDVLEHELGTVTRVVPKRVVDRLKSVVVWVEWDDTDDPDHGRAVAKYYGVVGNRALWSLGNSKHPGKANNVEIVSMLSLTREHQPAVKADRCVILHELAHAVHFHAVGSRSPQVAAAYQQAMDRNLYDEAKDVTGRTVKPYAAANENEYFAELTCAYLDKLHYFPFTRDDLKGHDPAGYKLMEAVWGPAKQIDAAIKKESEAAAQNRVQKAKNLLAEKKKAEAKALFEKVAEYFPKTMGAAEARKILGKWRE